MKRAAGILMPISSLPSPHGVGTLGKAAYRFAEFLRGAGCSIWQVLPLQPTSFGNSPYQSCAAEALNPYFIDLDFLVRDGLLTKEEVLSADGDETRVDYGGLYRTRIPLLKRAFARFNGKEPAWQTFLEKGEYRDYAIFAALKEEFGGAPFWEWGEYADYDGEKIARFEQTHSEEVQFLLFTQFLFLTQWRKLKAYANARGKVETVEQENPYIAAFTKTYNGGKITVLVNLSDFEPISLDVSSYGKLQDVLDAGTEETALSGGTLTMQPYSIAIFR